MSTQTSASFRSDLRCLRLHGYALSYTTEFPSERELGSFPHICCVRARPLKACGLSRAGGGELGWCVANPNAWVVRRSQIFSTPPRVVRLDWGLSSGETRDPWVQILPIFAIEVPRPCAGGRRDCIKKLTRGEYEQQLRVGDRSGPAVRPCSVRTSHCRRSGHVMSVPRRGQSPGAQSSADLRCRATRLGGPYPRASSRVPSTTPAVACAMPGQPSRIVRQTTIWRDPLAVANQRFALCEPRHAKSAVSLHETDAWRGLVVLRPGFLVPRAVFSADPTREQARGSLPPRVWRVHEPTRTMISSGPYPRASSRVPSTRNQPSRR